MAGARSVTLERIITESSDPESACCPDPRLQLVIARREGPRLTRVYLRIGPFGLYRLVQRQAHHWHRTQRQRPAIEDRQLSCNPTLTRRRCNSLVDTSLQFDKMKVGVQP